MKILFVFYPHCCQERNLQASLLKSHLIHKDEQAKVNVYSTDHFYKIQPDTILWETIFAVITDKEKS